MDDAVASSDDAGAEEAMAALRGLLLVGEQSATLTDLAASLNTQIVRIRRGSGPAREQ